MDRRTALVLALAGLSIVAIGLAAATLGAVDTDDSGGGGGGGDGVATPPPMETGSEDPIDTIEPPTTLLRWVAIAVTVVSLVFLVYVLIAGPPERRRRMAKLVAVLAAVLVLVWLLGPLLEGIGSPGDRGFEPPELGDPGLPGEPGESEDSSSDLPDGFVWAVLGAVALVVVAGIAYVKTGGGGLPPLLRSEYDTEDEAPDPAAEALGRAAGRAADRIADEDGSEESLDNEVYRAWEEMTRSVSVDDPETTTPREFETAAVQAGVPEGDVRELTRLFEDVRYGGHRPTQDRERRAIDCFRRIESAVAPEEA